MQKEYKSLQLEIFEFDAEDIITDSGCPDYVYGEDED